VEILRRNAGLGLQVAGVIRLVDKEAAKRMALAGVTTAIIVLEDLDGQTLSEAEARLRHLLPHAVAIPDLLSTEALAVAPRGRLAGRHGVRWGLHWLVACVGGLLVLPFVLTLALTMRISSGGSAWFRQRRLGREGEVFVACKLRTMCVQAEARLAEVLAADSDLRAEYDRYHKLRDDPRVTRLGRWLRRWSIDELPQLWNVVRGDMCLVGPRPYLPEERARMRGADTVILSVRPGITGLWQVNGRNVLSFRGRLALDVWYVRHWSPALDIYVLLRSLPAVLRPGDAS